MNYGEFLLQWYNLVFLAAVGAGLAAALAGPRLGRDPFSLASGCLSTGLAGLTLNGAVHDLALGDPAGHFWWVLPASLLVGLGLGWALTRARDRWFAPIRGVRWNPGGEEGSEARVVSSSVDEAPGSGRAQWQDEEGVVTLVRCHTGGGTMKFGARVRLEEFDEADESYRVVYRSE